MSQIIKNSLPIFFSAIVALLFIYCKGNDEKNLLKNPSKNEKYADSIISEINDLVSSEYFGFSEERQYLKKDNKIFILVHEELNNFKGKGIGYSKDILLGQDSLKNEHYQFYFLGKEHVFTKYKSYRYRTDNEDKHFSVKIDSIFFKNGTIYLWKNKQANQQIQLQKEKEIRSIKKEIDSILKL